MFFTVQFQEMSIQFLVSFILKILTGCVICYFRTLMLVFEQNPPKSVSRKRRLDK